VVMVQYFILNAGVMSGFEAVLGLIVFDAYGWGQREGFRVWGPLTAMLFFFFSLLPTLLWRLNWAKVACAVTCFQLFIFAGINYENFSEVVPLWRMYVSLMGLCALSVNAVLNQTLLSQRLPPHLQAFGNAVCAGAGTAGRTIGPLLSTALYAAYQGGGLGSAPNASFVMMAASGALIMVAPVPFFTTIFGPCGAPSPKQLAEEQTKGG